MILFSFIKQTFVTFKYRPHLQWYINSVMAWSIIEHHMSWCIGLHAQDYYSPLTRHILRLIFNAKVDSCFSYIALMPWCSKYIYRFLMPIKHGCLPNMVDTKGIFPTLPASKDELRALERIDCSTLVTVDTMLWYQYIFPSWK